MRENGKYLDSCLWLLVFFVAGLAALGGCSKKQPAAAPPIPPGEYTVVDAEDNLSHISLRAYGDMNIGIRC